MGNHNEELEQQAIVLLRKTAEAFNEFCLVLAKLKWDENGSVYNLLVTYDEVMALESGLVSIDPEQIVIELARAGLVAGPYDEEGQVAQRVADELLINLEELARTFEDAQAVRAEAAVEPSATIV